MGSLRDTQIEKLVKSGTELLGAITKFFEAATETISKFSNPGQVLQNKVRNDSKNVSDRS
jgi:hypothetical protein